MLEQAVTRHGDMLYRMALLLADDERQAERALRAAVRRAAQAGPSAAEVPELLALLFRAIREQAERPPLAARVRLPRLPFPSRLRQSHADSGLYAAIRELEPAQRQALGSHLLLGYDAATAARISGTDAEHELTLFSAALHRVARVAGIVLPYASSSDECAPVRRALTELSGTIHSDPLLRGHLATCSACRAFDSAWSELARRTESALRDTLRDRTLPSALRARLLADIRPAPPWWKQSSPRVAFLLLGVVALIGMLVLPGFFNQPRAAELQATNPLADPRGLIRQALEQFDQPFSSTAGVWHGRWETLWFFDDTNYAPIQADAWIDAGNPARHRLQVAHAEGGAPFEFQLGNGSDALWYALDPVYRPSLYGSETPGVATRRPELVHWAMNADEQNEARRARLQSGIWGLGPAYLRQAEAAPDLRTLGRRRDGRNTVQIVSFSGNSPLDLPPDAPGAGRKITILLALDIRDGRLRSVTELLGPAGSTQSSRVTWRLRAEEWLVSSSQINPVFDIGQAWTGQGEFSERPTGPSGDRALLLLAANETAHPARLLAEGAWLVWLPTTPPPGITRATLRWEPPVPSSFAGAGSSDGQPHSMIYSGPGRWLSVNLSGSSGAPGEERITIDDWTVHLSASKGQRYRIDITRQSATPAAFGPGRNGTVVMEAQGFTRAELLDVVRSLTPFSLEGFNAQKALFSSTFAPEISTLLQAALAQSRPPAAGEVLYRRERIYYRQNPQPDTLGDPYHRPPYNGLSADMINEQWFAHAAPPRSFVGFIRISNTDGAVATEWHVTAERSWYHQVPFGVVQLWPGNTDFVRNQAWFSGGDRIVLELLSSPVVSTTLTMQADGTRVISVTQTISQTRRYTLATEQTGEGWPHLADLEPQQIMTELTIPPGEKPSRMQVFAVGSPQILLSTAAGQTVVLRETPSSLGGEVYSNPGWLAQALGGTDALDQIDTTAPFTVTTRPATQTLIQEWELLEEARRPLAEAPAVLQNDDPPTALVTLDSTGIYSATGATPVARDITLDEARTLARSPLWLLPTTTLFQLERIEAGIPGGLPSSEELSVQDAVGRGLALRFTYREGSGRSLVLTQGPARPLRAFLQTHWGRSWSASEQQRVTIAGRTLDVWAMTDEGTSHSWLFAELDDTLLIVEDWSDRQDWPLLAQLRQLR